MTAQDAPEAPVTVVATHRPVRYAIDLTPEAWLALIRHGYDPTRPRRGTRGGPEIVHGYRIGSIDGAAVFMPLRNRVCELDGIEIDGHGGSDLDPASTACIYCHYEGPNP